VALSRLLPFLYPFQGFFTNAEEEMNVKLITQYNDIKRKRR